jgi:hypothetical protein
MLNGAAMGVRMMFSSFAGMVRRMQPVPVSDIRVVRGLFVVPGLVLFGGFAVVGRGMFVMFSRFSVMFRSFVVFHSHILFLGEMCGCRRQGPLRTVIQSNSSTGVGHNLMKSCKAFGARPAAKPHIGGEM